MGPREEEIRKKLESLRAVKTGPGLGVRMFMFSTSFCLVILIFSVFFFNVAVCKDPPYKVEESGYAGFILPIEVYFKNKVCDRYPNSFRIL